MDAQFRRRQAIINGLAPLLREDQTLVALEIFDRSFAHGPAFNLQKYVDQLCERLVPSFPRRDLHRALVASVFLGGSGGEGKLDMRPESDGPSPANRVFEHLLGGFLSLVAGTRPKVETAVRTYLAEKLGALGLSVVAQKALSEWLSRRQANIGTPISRESMRNLLNLAYVLVCEYLGPVVADRLLSQAVAETEALPEAHAVAPRSLL